MPCGGRSDGCWFDVLAMESTSYRSASGHGRWLPTGATDFESSTSYCDEHDMADTHTADTHATDAHATDTHADALRDVDVLFFDVYGTLLDWKGSVARGLQRLHADGAHTDSTYFVSERCALC